MKLYTSYFARVRKFPRNLVGLSTARFRPKYMTMGKDARGVICVDCPPFKPGRGCDGLCRGDCDPKTPESCLFLKFYKEQLDELNLTSVQASLGRLAAHISKQEKLPDIDFAFLFFETPDNPCSERHMVQQWFREHGVEIEEWQPPEKASEEDVQVLH